MSDIINSKFGSSCFQLYLDYIHEKTGITIGKSRKTMVASRVRKRARELEISDYNIYLDMVKSDIKEQTLFIDAITTHETYFYRTPEVWQYLSESFVPNYCREYKQRDLKVWSAAASTGEEAYTIAIILSECKRVFPSLNFDILATDISDNVLKKAQSGIYSGHAIEKFRLTKPNLFKCYLKSNGKSQYRVIPELKSKVAFKTHNLFSFPQFEHKFDVIFLRNVLIYFNKEDQEKVLFNIHKCLSPQGILIIGESESLLHMSSSFEYLLPHIYKPIGTSK